MNLQQINSLNLHMKLIYKNKIYYQKTPKAKIDYIKPINKIIHNNKINIHCYCCSNIVDLNSSGCHRSHNIPKKIDGDWFYDNIYLFCATCNHDMGTELTVEEYKVSLFIKIKDYLE